MPSDNDVCEDDGNSTDNSDKIPSRAPKRPVARFMPPPMEPDVPSFLPPKKTYQQSTERESFNNAPPTRQIKPSTATRGPVIYLTNLDFSVTEQDIMKYLQGYNPVRAKLLKDATGRSKGTGFVEVQSQECAKSAI